jgi:hypothetical protein
VTSENLLSHGRHHGWRFESRRMLLQKADALLVEQALSELPMRLREVLVLRELEGLSYKEISAVVGVPMGTVMSRLSRARERFWAGGARTREAASTRQRRPWCKNALRCREAGVRARELLNECRLGVWWPNERESMTTPPCSIRLVIGCGRTEQAIYGKQRWPPC